MHCNRYLMCVSATFAVKTVQLRPQDAWVEIPPKKTAWGTETESGWWELQVNGADERVSVKLRGRMTKVSTERLQGGADSRHTRSKARPHFW